MFSSIKLSLGERHAIIKAYELPPSDYLRRHVNFESLYGIWLNWFLFFALDISARDVITFLRVNSDLLISILSYYARPFAPVRLVLSLPAKSTNWSFEMIVLSICELSIISN